MKTKFVILCAFILSLFAFEVHSQRPTPNNGWKDSYKANNLCWCDSSFDHDVDNINKVSFVINGKKRNIRDICDELKKHPSYRTLRNGDPIYNDIQCGNGPANTAGDEDPDQCPGRVDKGRAGCTEIGPKWDVAWLSGRSRFDGGGNPPPPPTNNNAPNVSFASPNNTASFNAPASINVTVNASDNDGSVSNVRLYINDTFIRQENVTPYEWKSSSDVALSNLGSGNYTLRAEATDNLGKKASASISITVGDVTPPPPPNNNAPAIVFQSPSNNASFTAPASINNVTVAPADSNRVGEIGNIRLYINNQFIRQENITKYEWSSSRDSALANLGTGTYTLRADATTKNGQTSTASITITVGNVTPNPTPTPPSGDRVVSIRARTTNKYVTSVNGLTPMLANRDNLGSWERFTMVSEGGNIVGFRGNNGKYVSSEDGNGPMNTNRDRLDIWERFTLVSRGANVYALRGNNGKYVSHNNGTSYMTCTSNSIGAGQEFIIQDVPGQKLLTANLATSASNIYPNPFKLDGILNLQVKLSEASEALVKVYDITGKEVFSRELGSLEAGTTIITLDNVQSNLRNSGIYMVQFQAGIYKQTMRLLVQ